jgi:hypothetical protein
VPADRWAWTGFDVDNGHHRRYTRARAAAALERSGFVVNRATYAFSAVFPFFAAERLVRRLRERLGGRGSAGPADVVRVPQVSPAVERLLLSFTRLDQRLLVTRDLPFGSSVFVAATKPAQLTQPDHPS